ncbi:hypothetical protein [Halobacterium yunchengense]|uniref:hypothetical protein n=1 Tax=Halobacterium yunchengense TaxID=3108497 RepID=UPI0030090D93
MPLSGDDATRDEAPDAGQDDAGGTREADVGGIREDDAGGTREADAGGTREDDAGGSHEADAGGTREDDASAARTRADAEAALSEALEDADGDPSCALCSKPADYFLYEAGHVAKFVCWEHVSPHSAAVDHADVRPGRPVALSL